MNSILDRYIDGKFEYETGSLDFSTPKIELTIHKDEVLKEQFIIHTIGEQRAEGYVLSSHIRLQCQQKTFSGQDCAITYIFDSKGMDEGEVLKTEFCIISNLGEYYIPFTVIIEHEKLQSSLGSIKNLFHFANLAKTNWPEAIKLFYKEEFADIFNGVDKQYYSAYQGLSNMYGNEQNVDEFLVMISKKTRTEYIPMEAEVRMDASAGINVGKATITRNGWGYTRLEVCTEGDFLSVEKDTLTDDDFLGNICSFTYKIDGNLLHAGNNYGRILISHADITTEIHFTVVGEKLKSLQLSNKQKMQEYILQLMRLYCQLRLRKITSTEWMKSSVQLVEKMNDIDARSMTARLFKAQLLITEERNNEAEWQLSMIQKEIIYDLKAPEIWCYYLYLTTLSNKNMDYVNKVAEEVEEIYSQNPTNWKIAWLLLFLREDFAKSPYRKWAFLEQQFSTNCKSPIIYVEAVNLINLKPTIMNKLSEFEIQIINFAAKNKALGAGMIQQFIYLMNKYKESSNCLYFILKQCYETSPSDEILQCLLAYLMKNNKTGSEYFPWYDLGVKHELRVTKLYEYYALSMPENHQRELPKMVMMYFSYHSELDYSRKAILYANVIQHKNEYPEIAASYSEAIDTFTIEQVKKGHINKELAFLYKNALTSSIITEAHLASYLIPILFTTMIHVDVEYIRSIVIIYDKLKGETVYPLSEKGTAYVPIYSSEYSILLQDAFGNRFCSTKDYSIEKLMIPGKYIKDISDDIEGPLEYDLYRCENARNIVTITENNYKSFLRLIESGRITEEYKNEIELKLTQYSFDNDMPVDGDRFLEAITPEKLTVKMRSAYIQMMLSRGMLDKAFSWVSRFGIEQIDQMSLVKLCSRILARTEFEQDDNLKKVAYQAFCTGKYDENIVKYLVAYFEGMTKDMRDIWKAAKSFEIDSQALCEKMLLQMLYSGSYVGQKNEIFEQYIQNGGRRIVEMAYLTHSAYEYFVKDRIPEDEIFSHFTKLFYRGEEFHKVCKYAYVKYYSENRTKIGEPEATLIRKFINQSLQEHVFFKNYQNLLDIVPDAQQLADKVIVEYHTNPKAKVFIHYILQRSDDDNGDYCTEEIQNMYEGIYIKKFTLFFGEKLQYYITEEIDGTEQLTQSDTIQKSETSQPIGESRYVIINDMMVAKTLQEYATISELAEEYMRKDYMVRKLFRLL